MSWSEIRSGGRIYYDPCFFSPVEADDLFRRLRELPGWQQPAIRGHPIPRLIAWFSDPGVDYRYSGLVHRGAGWPAEVWGIKERVEAASGSSFNSLLLNRYRGGQDSIGFHADDEPELGPDPVVASLSFGAERDFVLKHRETGERRVYRPAHGSLLVMAGSTQHHWLHGVPKTKQETGERINLTFRRIF